MARIARPWYAADKRCYRAYVNGQRVTLLKGERSAANFRAAQKKLRQILSASKNDTAPNALRVADVLERYLRLHQSKYSERAFEERRRYLQLFAEAHGFRKVNDRDCLPVHVEEWLAEHAEWQSDWTKAQVVSIVMRPFNWAAQKRLIPSNPFRGVEKTQGQPRRPLTEAEFRKLLRHATVWKKRKRTQKIYPCERKRRLKPSAGARFRQVLIFLRYTGCRPGELCGLEWTDIDLEQRVIVLRRHKTSKKTRKPRVVPLHPVVLKLLITIKRQEDPGNHVFVNHRKNPWNRSSLSLRVQRARETAGIPDDAKLYGLRHAFGTRAILNGVDIKTLSELLGHTTTRMSEHYIHLAGQRSHLAAAMEKVNGGTPTPPASGQRPAS